MTPVPVVAVRNINIVVAARVSFLNFTNLFIW